jgi:cysteine desulfurase family protein (TIGR01976 family)
MELDVAFVRRQFPAFSHPETGRWAFFENAGGSYVPAPVIERLDRFFVEHKVQPYGPFETSRRAGEEMDESYTVLAGLLNAGVDELTIGPSTTLNTYVLSQAVRPVLRPGDEIVVTNQDHEANIGCWRKLAEFGIVIREWRIDPGTGELRIADLEALLSERTRLVCFTLCSNVVGTFNDVAAIVGRAAAAGAWTVADGVSQAPHTLMDARGSGLDGYLFSTYKTFGTHTGVLWCRPEFASRLASQGHWFNAGQAHYRLNPTGPQHAEIAALAGLGNYLDILHDHHFGNERGADRRTRALAVYGLIGNHESRLANRLLAYLSSRPDVRIIGRTEAAPGVRAATVAITVAERRSTDLAEALAQSRVAVRAGHFYARRCVEALGVDPDDGVLRMSLVHYNDDDDVTRLIEALDETLDGASSRPRRPADSGR